jgi:hypothetical protein
MIRVASFLQRWILLPLLLHTHHHTLHAQQQSNSMDVGTTTTTTTTTTDTWTRNLDVFNYRTTQQLDGYTEFGPPDWGDIQCTDLETCVRTLFIAM